MNIENILFNCNERLRSLNIKAKHELKDLGFGKDCIVFYNTETNEEIDYFPCSSYDSTRDMTIMLNHWILGLRKGLKI